MQICQPIRAKTKSGINFRIVILEEGNKFSVLMTDTAFPAGTVFDTPELALQKSLEAVSAFYPGDQIISLVSSPVEEFITNEKLAQFLF
ncbi:hypothetical protein [Methylicorpusculum sp.]|uniref:hypothetical protein n=1 Tax=Methylicorpusculum sp. TaxID=2713644 RepID=UPI002AB91A37|nr:hypothetical protein [Methylicorpusculum sp.]MDZ4152393.1 hypothetical protein [Methylicorpusculum sp.]